MRNRKQRCRERAIERAQPNVEPEYMHCPQFCFSFEIQYSRECRRGPAWIARGVLLLAILGCAACANPTLQGQAERQGLVQGRYEHDGLTLQRWYRPAIDQAQGPLTIYLEGDGQPWQGGQPAEDPTGRHLLALALMVQDQAPAIYLTRPCYHLVAMPPACTPELWTSARYGAAVIAAVREAVIDAQRQFGSGRGLRLVGYSGGGVLALLVAAELEHDHVQVVTVSANLDTQAWTEHHGVLPLSRSRNPVTDLPDALPFMAVHLVGGADRTVPPATLSAFERRYPQHDYREFPDFDHRCCWVEHWQLILATIALPAGQGTSSQR